MKIALCHSMHHSEKAKEAQAWFARKGHEAQPSKTADAFIGLDDAAKEKQKLLEKYEHDAIREHYNVIRDADAVLILNYERHGIPGYVGGNSFLEMGFAYILGKPIYLLNPIPAMPYYETEIIAMRPTVINGDLNLVLNH